MSKISSKIDMIVVFFFYKNLFKIQNSMPKDATQPKLSRTKIKMYKNTIHEGKGHLDLCFLTP